MSNARKYTPAGGEIRLRARNIVGSVEIAITDTGLGIPAEALPRLFDKFFRVDLADRKQIRGTGLGLAIVKQIVEASGGQIGAESAGLGKGSRFWFTLPLAGATGVETSTVSAPVPTSRAPLRLLAVDDDPAIGNAVRRILRSDGVAVTAVTSAEEALVRMRAEAFDVVISDLGLGSGMNGWQLADEVRKAWPSVRFVLASGSVGADFAGARSHGVHAVLEKPYRPAELRRVVLETDLAQAAEGCVR